MKPEIKNETVYELSVAEYYVALPRKKNLSTTELIDESYRADYETTSELVAVIENRRMCAEKIYDSMRDVLADSYWQQAYGHGVHGYFKVVTLEKIAYDEDGDASSVEIVNQYAHPLYGENHAQISLDDGNTLYDSDDVEEIMDEIEERDLWDQIVELMDDETRESVHRDYAPCSNKMFLEEYLRRAEDDLIIG